jgi:HSP20 family protein
MALTLWEPTSIRDAVNKMFEDRNNGQALLMPIDVLETPDELLVKASFPGSSKDKFDINYQNEILSIKAELPNSNGHPEGTRYLLRERSFGSVTRSFKLPFPVDTERASAEYVDGVLSLTLPKQEAVKPRSIKVN